MTARQFAAPAVPVAVEQPVAGGPLVVVRPPATISPETRELWRELLEALGVAA